MPQNVMHSTKMLPQDNKAASASHVSGFAFAKRMPRQGDVSWESPNSLVRPPTETGNAQNQRCEDTGIYHCINHAPLH